MNVIYGSAMGLTAQGDQLWLPGKVGLEVTDGRFGEALASGDFNLDGFADLAIGAPDYNVDGVRRAGAVVVLYGSAGGLTPEDHDVWSQANLPGVPETSDWFGWSLASADFDGDGYADLAMAVLGQDIDGVAEAGLVEVIPGGPIGLVGASAVVLTEEMAGGTAKAWAMFGAALAAGDFDDDGLGDLVVRVPNPLPGDLSVFYGNAGGLGSGDAAQLAIGGEWELAVGDFDGDGDDDLAAGAPSDRGGKVRIVPGSVSGLAVGDVEVWRSGSPGVPGRAEEGDRFGEGIGAGDFDGDGIDDLAIAVPGKDTQALFNAGIAIVLYGTPTGPAGDRAQKWSQGSAGIPGRLEYGDEFGHGLAAADYDGSGQADLIVGVPFEDLGAVQDAGMVVAIYGSPSGLSAAGAQSWSQDHPGVIGAGEYRDQFGLVTTQ